MSSTYLSPRAAWRAKLLGLNWWLISLVVGIGAIGVTALYSVANGSFEPWALPQLYRLLLGFVLMIGVAMVDMKHWLSLAYLIFTIGLIALFGVEFFGETQMGARRWLDMRFINIQPSEPMRLALTLALARYYHNLPIERVSHPGWLLLPILMILVPYLLIIRQPDLGTAILFSVIGVSILFVAGVSWRYFFAGAISFIPLSLFAWVNMHSYQKDRVLTFLNPDRDPLGAGYHILQSKIAIGSGGVWGKGFMKGTQSNLNFLPEKHTDFIFTMLAEEIGLMGCLGVLSLYFAVLAVGFYIGFTAKSQFGRLIAVGVSISLFLYVFVNVAMVIGLLPVVGVPMPLISYGGTSLLTLMVSIGLLLNVHLNRNVEMSQG